MRHRGWLWSVVACAGLVACGGESGGGGAQDAAQLDAALLDAQAVDAQIDAGPADAEPPAPVQEAPALETIAPPVTAQPQARYRLRVVSGGGQLSETEVQADASGALPAVWTMGYAPVYNRLHIQGIEGDDLDTTVAVRAVLAQPYTPERVGDVDAWLRDHSREGSTEDLTFLGDDLLIGVPGGLLKVSPDGLLEPVPLTGEAVGSIWGFAADLEGNLWAVDAHEKVILKIDGAGEVSVAITTDGEAPLVGPNYVAVGHDGRVYVSDPCAGQIVRYDPREDSYARHAFDLVLEGGPNGMAIGPDGALYVATENTGLLCQHTQVPMRDNIAGVYRLDVNDFETREPVVEGVGLFADGLAFDVEGNLYVVTDTIDGLRIDESDVQVVPAGTREIYPFARAQSKQLIANVAFGRGDYGAETLWLGMLHIAPFTEAAARGVARVPVGIEGLPLLP